MQNFSKGVSKWGFECSIRVIWASTYCSIRVFRSYEDFQSPDKKPEQETF